MRIDKYLTKTGLGNRKQVKELLKRKQIIVDDKLITNDNFQVSENANVYYKDDNGIRKLEYEEYIYLMLNKPQDYVCATKDNLHKTVLDLIVGYEERELHIVGRLDVDTEGLLLITDDGNFTHKVTSPKSNISKKYYVEYSGVINDNAITMVEEGIILDDGEKTKSGTLEPLTSSSAYITIFEGKFHQVKKMIAALGGKVTFLKRVMIGDLNLDVDLGKSRKLTKEDLNKIV